MDEEEVLRVRCSRKLYIPIYLMILVLVATVLFIKFSGKELNTFAVQASIVFILLLIGSTELHRFNNLYKLEQNALIHVKGILRKITRRTDLLAVSDADISQNLWQMMLAYGNVSVRVFSQESTMHIRNIDKPGVFVDTLENCMSKKRAGNAGGGMGR